MNGAASGAGGDGAAGIVVVVDVIQTAVPAVSEVATGTKYGPYTTQEYTGTMAAGSGGVFLPNMSGGMTG